MNFTTFIFIKTNSFQPFIDFFLSINNIMLLSLNIVCVSLIATATFSKEVIIFLYLSSSGWHFFSFHLLISYSSHFLFLPLASVDVFDALCRDRVAAINWILLSLFKLLNSHCSLLLNHWCHQISSSQNLYYSFTCFSPWLFQLQHMVLCL